MGDCKNVLGALLSVHSRIGDDALFNKTNALSKLSEVIAVQGGYVKQALYIGILVGLSVAVLVGAAYCYVRRQSRMVKHGSRKYTPYGEVDDFMGSDHTVPHVASAADDDE